MERTADFPCLLLQLLIEFPRKPQRQRHFRGLFFCHPLTSSLCTRRLRWGVFFCFNYVLLVHLLGKKKDFLNGTPKNIGYS